MRLDVYVAQFWPEHSRSTWQKLIEQGAVSVNGDVQTSTKYDLDEDDHVTVELPKQVDHSAKTLPILYQDENVIVIDKPVGVLTHSKGALNDEFTVAEFVRPFTSYKSDTNRPGIIHRLDRATSGVIVCALNDEAASMLQRQFSERTLKKEYMAVVCGVPKEHSATLSLPIARNPSKPSTFRVDANGKTAETAYDVIKSNDVYSLISLQPKTGRTHQLRVHMAYIKTPILGDAVYGTEPAERMYLHAAKLEATIPKGKRMVFESEVPTSFKKVVSS